MTNSEITSIRADYKKQIMSAELVAPTFVTPTATPQKPHHTTRQFFVGVVGLVGAGKTTVIKPLAEKMHLIRISSDEVRQLMKERGFGYDNLMDIVAPLAEELAAQGFNLAFDADCGNPLTKKMIEDLAEKVQAKLFWIHVNPPEEFIVHKLKSFKHTWLFRDGDQAVANYFAQKEKRLAESRKTNFDFIATVDTSKVAVDIAAEINTIASRIYTQLSSAA